MITLYLRSPINSRLRLLARRRCIVSDRIIESKANRLSRFPDGSTQQQFHRTMSTGATRAATTAFSQNVKQKLVKLLFREKCSRTGSHGHEYLNFSVYSYKDLRRAYLKRLQVIHPDKICSNSIDVNRRQFRNQQHQKSISLLHSKEELKIEFQELQSAWDRYEELSKNMMKVIQGDGDTANFTKFGVGCSFSDNEEEKALRKEITDQACRGWFTSGLISTGLSTENDGDHERDGQYNNTSASSKFSQRVASTKKSLIDDSMFVHVELCDKYVNLGASSRGTKIDISRRYQRTLIPGIK